MNPGLRKALVLLIILVSTRVYSQFYQLRNYNVSDGLPSSDVYDMIQDSQGYLWFSGDMGVSRYDGYEFKNFSTENGLPDNSIVILHEDHKGRIWFLSFTDELAYYYKGVIRSFKDINKKIHKHPLLTATSMYVDEGDTIWIGYGAGVIKILPGWDDLKVEKISFDESGGYIYKIDKTGFVYGTYTHPKDTLGAHVYIKDRDAVFDVHVYDKGKKEYSVRLNHGDPDVKVKLYCLRLKNSSFLFSLNDHVFHFNSKGIIRYKKEDNYVIGMFECGDSLLLGTYGGLRTYTGETFIEEPRIMTLEKKSIGAMCRDHENGLWFCTEGQGIYYLPHLNFQYYTPEDGLSESKVSEAELVQEKVTLGHLNASISIIDKQSINSIPLDPVRNTIGLNEIDGLICKKNGKLLAGTRSGTYEIDLKNPSRVKKIKLRSRKLIPGSKGNIWAVRFGDIHEYDSTLKIIRLFKIKPYTDNMFEDSKGNIWACSIKGLWLSNGTSTLEYLGEKNRLLSNRIVDIKETPDGTLWMASRGAGVIIKKKNKFLHFTKKDGLLSNMCRTVFKDKKNTIWIGTNSGLSRIELTGDDRLKVRNFSTPQGLLSKEVNHILQSEDKLWLIHNNGVTLFNPDKLIYNTVPPPVYIHQVSANDSAIKNKQLPDLEHNQNNLTFQFVALSFKAPGEIRYKYKLEGIDTYWNYTNQTSAKYQALPPGKYNFIVQAQNNDGFWSNKPARFSFTIQPAWWQTWFFKLVLGTVIVALVIVIFQKRLRDIKEREMKKSAIQRRVDLSELMALRAQMNPHFVFNVINSVQHFITGNDAVSSQKYLSKFAKLIRYVFDNSKPTSVDLKTELDALRLYLELEALRFENRFHYAITLDEEVNIAETQIPSMLIQPYVENAIWHGLMHKKEKGRIEIRILLEGTALKCIIEDNGIGRQRSNELKKERPSDHKSAGMSITNERLKIMNDLSKRNLNVRVEDLADTDGIPAGTKVELTIHLA